MFGIGGSELIVILIVALLFLGPDKLPDAAKQISKGIRDLKKQSRILQESIENDEHIGGALRDLKSALRGDEAPIRPPVRKPPPTPSIQPPAETVEAKQPDPAPAPSPEPQAALPAPEPDPAAELIKPAAGIVAKGELAPEPAIDPPAEAPLDPQAKQTHG